MHQISYDTSVLQIKCLWQRLDVLHPILQLCQERLYVAITSFGLSTLRPCVLVSLWSSLVRAVSPARAVSFLLAVWLYFISYVTMTHCYISQGTQPKMPKVATVYSISLSSPPLYVLNIILLTGHQDDGPVVSHESQCSWTWVAQG